MRGAAIVLGGLALAAVTGCAGTPASGTAAQQDWAVTARVVLDGGLASDNPSMPGQPGTQALAYVNGQVFVAYTNLYNEITPAGPSYVSVHDGTTLAMTAMFPLEMDGGSEPVRCTDAGAMRASGDSGTVLVSCAGSAPANQAMATQDGMLVVLSSSPPAITQMIPINGSPGAVFQSGSRIFLGDLESPNLHVVNAETGEETSMVQVCSAAMENYVSDVIVVNGRGFVACFADNTVQEFDPATGATMGNAVLLGTDAQGPVSLAALGGQVEVVNSLSGTVNLISLTESQATLESSVITLDQSQGGDDLQAIAGDSSFAAVTDAGFGTLVILSVTDGFQVTSAVDLKASPTASAPDAWGVADGDGVFYVAITGWGVPPAELVRVAKVR